MHKSKIVRVISSETFWLSAVFLVFATCVNFFFSDLIQYYFPDRQPIIDTLFIATPYVVWTQYLTDIAVIISPAVLIYNIIIKDLEFLPYYISAFSIGYFIRGILIFFNPIGGAHGNMDIYGLTTIMQHGMFPSGHTILVFIAYALSRQICDTKVRYLLLAMCIIEVASLILSRGHYAIDIVGGMLVAYFVVSEIKKRKGLFKLSRATI